MAGGDCVLVSPCKLFTCLSFLSVVLLVVFSLHCSYCSGSIVPGGLALLAFFETATCTEKCLFFLKVLLSFLLSIDWKDSNHRDTIQSRCHSPVAISKSSTKVLLPNGLVPFRLATNFLFLIIFLTRAHHTPTIAT